MQKIRLHASLSVFTVGALTLTSLAAGSAVAFAAPKGGDSKVRICHRTNAVTNPYVSIEVAQSSVDGNGGNDKGQGDHYLNHTGPVWTPKTTKKDDWGDIIPPIPGIHDGRNWTPEGQAIWSAGCQYEAVTDTDNDGVIDVTDPDTDHDGIPDAVDPDDDNDGTPDTTDPDESTTVDTDGDKVPDATDSDDDGDGLTDTAECDVPVVEDPALPPTAAPTDTVTETTPTDPPLADDSTKTNNAQTGVGQTDSGAGAPRMLAASVDKCGVVTEVPDTPSDVDQDGIPDTSDKDDDGDGKPDMSDGDHDGDGIPDVEDADDDGDNVPDALDPDHTGEPQDPERTDTDGDGIPDTADRDDDGDGVVDVKDADQDGDGQPETVTQTVNEVSISPVISSTGFTPVFTRVPKTSAGQKVTTDVTCVPAQSARAFPFGGGSKEELANYACDVIPAANPKVRLRVNEPVKVTVRMTAPAVGQFKALDRTVTTVIR